MSDKKEIKIGITGSQKEALERIAVGAELPVEKVALVILCLELEKEEARRRAELWWTTVPNPHEAMNNQDALT